MRKRWTRNNDPYSWGQDFADEMVQSIVEEGIHNYLCAIVNAKLYIDDATMQMDEEFDSLREKSMNFVGMPKARLLLDMENFESFLTGTSTALTLMFEKEVKEIRKNVF